MEAGTSTSIWLASMPSYDNVSCSSNSDQRTPRGPQKRLVLSDRIILAKARLNTLTHRKTLLYKEARDELFEEKSDQDDNVKLLEAAKSGKDSKVKLLIAQGCSKDYVDERGRTALHWAAEYGYIRAVHILIEAEWDINLQDSNGQTPLHVGCDHRNGNIVVSLISHGCIIRTQDLHGRTPLHRAIHSNLETVVNMLCDLGADVNAKTNNGWTPLHEAARIGNERIIRKLIQHGANVNAVSNCKSTPFLTAVFYFRIAHRSSYISLEPILNMFIENGCHLSHTDGQWTPLISAISVFNSTIAGKLLYHGCLIPEKEGYSRSLIVDAFANCDDFFIKMFLYAGYRVKPEEVDQCAKRIPAFSMSFLKLAFPGYAGKERKELEILRFLRERASQPISLQELCRKSIRVELNRASRDTSILGRISLLPLPTKMKHFISLREHAAKFI